MKEIASMPMDINIKINQNWTHILSYYLVSFREQ